ncbi:MAG: ABC transporter permease [Desulfopila sp.]|jgi:ABC-2 type transport system permease protein|nr:ABC transporter permease [Desulfopila sp.]
MKLYASIIKEMLLLLRDRAGMVLLFIMPAFLVIVITLIQDKVTTTNVEVLFIDDDKGMVGRRIHTLLADTEIVHLVKYVDGEQLSADDARDLVDKGKYQFALVLPKGLSSGVAKAIEQSVRSRLFPEENHSLAEKIPEILLWFDPTVSGSFRSAVSSVLYRAVHGLQAELLMENTFTLLPDLIFKDVPEVMRSYLPQETLNGTDLLPQLFENKGIIPVMEQFTTEMGFINQPTAVQQNVPAWTIFGIFFISVPLAGSFIQERQNGTLKRLKVFPVSYWTIMAGKLSAYGAVCLVQTGVILAAGIFILPLLGLEPFSLGNAFLHAAALLFSVTIAACGYGILLGTIGRTYEQIAVFAPVSIVIAAAIGGIMVPVYAMPELIRPLCAFSPLYWGQSGFYDILLRQSDWPAILPEIAALLSFGFLSGLGAYFSSRFKN